MGATIRYLSATEQAKLIEWIVENGRTYEKYVEWCDREGIDQSRRFTPVYYLTWMKRRKLRIREARDRMDEAAKLSSVMGRKSRLLMLEESLSRMQKRLARAEIEMSVSDHVRIEEQIRRTLEAIAKERGEFNTKPEDDNEIESRAARNELNRKLQSFFAKSKEGA